jgi:hypothetical protein
MSDKQSLLRFYRAEPKLLIRRVIDRQDRLLCAFTEREMVFKKDINPFIITAPDFSTRFVLGVLNSRLISWLYVNTSSIATKDDFRQTTLAELRSLPIPRLDAGDQRRARMEGFVARMLLLHEQVSVARTPDEKVSLERQIAATDTQIDRLVYDLFGLTAGEISLVEATVESDQSPGDSPDAPSSAKAGKSTPQSEADAAHFYSVKEEPPAYGPSQDSLAGEEPKSV